MSRSCHVKNRTIVVIFIVGYPSDAVELKSVLDESELHDDILLTTIRETYSNLPLKTHSLFQYKEYFCKNALYLAKTDDDVVIDTDRLVSSLDRFRGENSIFGYLYEGAIPKRNPQNKWYVTVERYQRSKYPNYVAGGFYLVTSDAVGKILRNVNKTSWIHIEDLLFTGLIPSLRLPGYWPCDANNQPFLIAEHDDGPMDAKIFVQKYDRLKKIKCSKLPFMIFSLVCTHLNICF
ncbi:unnamed protein product [Anisakis simplex]|uniref:Hexosyltransferase n=1 Tax=Anisakis simplex TaxID=6269 RepID=A0A0M3K454_ANISI|nr:unnamed protein product [Anisakis simplex]